VNDNAERDQLRDALEEIAMDPCEHLHNRRCWREPGYHTVSLEWATRICNPCRAHRALTPNPE
jgi:hypothetical protein